MVLKEKIRPSYRDRGVELRGTVMRNQRISEQEALLIIAMDIQRVSRFKDSA